MKTLVWLSFVSGRISSDICWRAGGGGGGGAPLVKTPTSGEDTSLAELREWQDQLRHLLEGGGGGGGGRGAPLMKTPTSGEDARLAELREGQDQLRHLLEGGERGGLLR